MIDRHSLTNTSTETKSEHDNCKARLPLFYAEISKCNNQSLNPETKEAELLLEGRMLYLR